jgi:hypothetical protein
MKCEKTELLRHLAVHNPAGLMEEPWSSHVRECALCRAEWGGFAWSLAIYKRIEQEHAARLNPAPRWNAFARRMAEQEETKRRARAFATPWLAGIMGLIVFGGVVSWGVWSEDGEPFLPSFGFQEASPLAVPSPASGRQVSRPVPARMLTNVSLPGLQPVSAAGGGYRRSAPEWRNLPRTTPFLETQTVALDRPSGELVLLPFSHARTQGVYYVPVRRNEANPGVPYGIGAPVR